MQRILIAVPLLVATFGARVTIADDAVLVLDRIEVRTTKSNGDAWDPGGGAPDLVLSVERTSKPKGERHVTAVEENVFKSVLARPALGIEDGDVIEIVVVDEDFGTDDEIGRTTQKITADMLRRGEVEVSFGQVDKLVLRFRRLADR